MRNKKLKKICQAALTIVLTIAMCVPSFAVPAGQSEPVISKSVSEVFQALKPASFDSMPDPYGLYGTNNTLTLYEQNELHISNNTHNALYYAITEITTTSGIELMTDSTNPKDVSFLDLAPYNGTYGGTFERDFDKRMQYTKCATFDSDGDGERESVAYLGWGDESYNYMFVWWYNTKTNETGGKVLGEDIGKPYGAWKGIADIDYTYRAQSFFSITSGDYDDDGLDSIVVAFNGDGNGSNKPTVVELEWNKGTKRFDEVDGKFDCWQYTSTAFYNSKIRYSSKYYDLLSIQLATGDVNDDGIDDLITLAYTNDTSSTYRDLKSSELYTPQLHVGYGVKNSGFPVTPDYTTQIMSSSPNRNQKRRAMV